MDSHTLRVLEYGEVLAKLAAHTSNSMGREAALALEPSPYPEMVRRRLQETAEARFLLSQDSGLPLGGIHDIRETVDRGGIGARLVARELLDIAATVGSSRRLKQFLQKRADHCPLLAEIGHNLPLFPQIEQKVEECIADTGDVKDTATPELARTRSELKVVHARIMEKLNSLLASEKYRTFIQEPIITLRDGRYCIPMKAENRSVVGGIVHDASASGATAFVEPAATLELGNRLRELAAKEEAEVGRILGKLSDLVQSSAADLKALIEYLANIDMIHARALLAEEMYAVEPALNREGICKLIAARHPLLSGKVVPIDVEVGDKFTVLLITGPNTGGKTVSLKTLGLLTLMAQSGLQIPAAEGSCLAIFDQVFADIGDEQDIQQSLSTFSAHLKNIVRICRDLGPNGLVLLDEIGAGTDPAEGAALAKAILDELKSRNARVIGTTHYGELKEYAYAHAGVENSAVEFNRETLAPTYRILLGVPGSSHAFYVAERLGLPKAVVDAARSNLSEREQTTSDLLQQIEESRKQAYQLERDALDARQEAEALRDEYEIRVREIEDVRRTVRREAEEEARGILRRATERVENILDELRKMNRGTRKGVSARQRLTAIKQEVAADLRPEEAAVQEPDLPKDHKFSKGDRVRVTTIGMDGELLENPKDGVVVVQIGSMRATLPVDVLRPAPKLPGATVKPRDEQAAKISMRKALQISPELTIRAMRVDEALPMLDRYMDDAYAAGLKQARIIHGKGTGALRRFVGDYLREHPAVDKYRLGDEGEGGDGATVVTFKT